MNWEQLKAILWLRWRLSVNQSRKAGTLNFVLKVIFVCSTLTLAAASFFLAIVIGIFLLPEVNPLAVMIVWDVMVGVLLCSWVVSLLVDVQRMELISLEKLLHLPMSLKDAFLLNYLSSVISFNTLCFFPAAIGTCIAMTIAFGPKMLILIPMVLSFILMLTAVTYHFRGWLASLMSDKRRQRTVVMVFTFGFVALTQVPNIVVQLTLPGKNRAELQFTQEQNAKTQALTDALSRQEITKEEFDRQFAASTETFKQQKKDAEQASQETLTEYLILANQVLPVGWLPYSSKSLMSGSIWHAGLCLLGMTLIGSASLWRSYSSTIKYYTGNVRTKAIKTSPNSTHGVTSHSAATSQPQVSRSDKSTFMEWKLPRISEHSTAIALCSFRNLVRAPESKVLFVGPMILGIMFLLMIFTDRVPKIPPGLEPFVWLAGIVFLTFMCLMLLLNMFGMDRGSFRCFILLPAQRSEVLFGKNISLLPLVSFIALPLAAGLSYMAPVGLLSFFACACQMLIALIFASLAGNWVSIQFPIAMAPGTAKPVQVNLVTMLVQMVVMMACPVFVLPGAAFFGIEWVLSNYFSIRFLPVSAVLSIIELWLVGALYLHVIQSQGQLLQSRETRILELLTANAE